MLRCLDIAGDHGGRITGPQHAIVRQDNAYGPKAAGIHWNVAFDHDAEAVEHGRPGHRFRGVEVVGHHLRRSGEIDGRGAVLPVDADLDADHLAAVGLIFVGTVGKCVDDLAHAFRGVVLDVAHVGFDDIKPEIADQLAQIRDAFFIGGDLRLQVGDVLVDFADRVGVVREQFDQFGFAEASLVDDQEVVDQHAFPVDRRGKRRH